MEKREQRKAEEKSKITIKDVTKFKLQDPATYDKKNLRVKTNKSVFKPSRIPDTFRTTPEGRLRSQRLVLWVLCWKLADISLLLTHLFLLITSHCPSCVHTNIICM